MFFLQPLFPSRYTRAQCRNESCTFLNMLKM
jgi:hypothetical protein